MKTSEILLQILEENKNEWISGEYIADSLKVSRAAVWKAIMKLRSEGYVIDAVRNKGYRIVFDSDRLSELEIWNYLAPECRMLDIHVLQETGSTNSYLREKADAGAPEGTVIISSMQTEGRGRLGRRFFSPAETGLYMSLLLRPVALKPEKALRLTTIAAVAACETIEAISGNKAFIKWVNDIYVGGKKVCGILTEGSIGLETGTLDSVVLGIGINVYPPEGGFPEEIKNIAGAVFDEVQKDRKNVLAAGFLNRFMRYYLAGDFSTYSAEYRKRSFVIGKEITVITENDAQKAKALDVDDDCRLVVQFEDGTIEHLSAGEISVKI